MRDKTRIIRNLCPEKSIQPAGKLRKKTKKIHMPRPEEQEMSTLRMCKRLRIQKAKNENKKRNK